MRNNTALKVQEPMSVTEELYLIQKTNNGLLDPVKVVDFARDPETALHSKFTWDDSKAAEQYRIWQARQIIRMELVVVQETPKGETRILADITDEKGKIVRAFVSIASDRRGDEIRGYRSLNDVLNDSEMRSQMLEEAKNDMNIFRRKYGTLKELVSVFEAMDGIV